MVYSVYLIIPLIITAGVWIFTKRISWREVLIQLGAVLVVTAIIAFASSYSKSDKNKINFTPQRPLMWWIDDIGHRTCALLDDPNFGYDTIPWPDDEHVYIAIDYKAYKDLWDVAYNHKREVYKMAERAQENYTKDNLYSLAEKLEEKLTEMSRKGRMP